MKRSMKNKLLSMLIAVAMILSTMPMAAFAADKNEITFTADKTEAHPGDTITYTITLGPVDHFSATNFYIKFKKGLTMVKGSGQLADGIVETLGNGKEVDISISDYAFMCDLTDMAGGTGSYEYVSDKDTVLATFSCKVDEDFSGKTSMFIDNYDYIDKDINPIESKQTIDEINVTIPATGISFETSELNLFDGDTKTLAPVIEPANATEKLVWSSSNDKIVTVDKNGKITAVKAGGPVDIKAKIGNLEAVCKVTVTCKHNLVVKNAKDSTCTEQGWDKYQECSKCHKLFNADGTEEISEIPYRNLVPHQGGTATCKEKAVCEVCGQPYGDYADHNYGSLVAEVPAKCEVAGTAAHYKCSVCGKLFDAEKNEVTAEQLVIPKLGHSPKWTWDTTNHWQVCTRTGCGEIIESTKGSHTFEWVIDKAPTEDANGLKHEVCSVCGAKRNEGTVIAKLDHVHVGITHHDAVAATCKSKGNVEYWTCSSPKCAGIYYGDAECKTVLESIETEKDMTNHTGGTEKKGKVLPTCTANGHEDDTYCLGCGEKIADGDVIPALGHDMTELHHDASGHWYECTRCDKKGNKENHKGGEATCIKKAKCEVCGEEYGELNPANHKNNNTEIRGAVKATEEKEGYTGDLYCKDCNTIIKKGSVIPKINHEYSAEWTTDKEGHWHECVNCHNKKDYAKHELEIQNAKSATEKETGYTGDKVCKVCGYVVEKGKVIPKLEVNDKPKTDDSSKVTDKPKTNDTPKTADTFNLFIWISTLLVSAVAAFTLTIANRKRKANK